MGLSARVRRRRRRADGTRERGSVAVEAALITPLLIIMVFGIIDFGFTFKNLLAVVSSTRAGVRTAAAEPRQQTFAQDAANQVAREGAALDLRSVASMWVYQADSAGYPVGAGGTFNSCSTNCVQFTYDATTKTFTPTSGSWLYTSQNACQGQQDAVGVYMKFNSPSMTGLFFKTLALSSHTVMVLEPIPTLNGCK